MSFFLSFHSSGNLALLRVNNYNVNIHRMKGDWNLFSTHFVALTKKRVQYAKRDKRGLVCEIVLPILMVIGGILIANSTAGGDIEALAIDDSMYGYKFNLVNAGGKRGSEVISLFSTENGSILMHSERKKKFSDISQILCKIFSEF